MKIEVSYIAQSCSKANKERMKIHDKNESSMHIIYLDPNNLYG